MRRILLVFMVLATVSACSDIETEQYTPKSDKETRKTKHGSLAGDEGLVVAGGRKKDDDGGGALGVNSYLWRATLDTLAFMPLNSADPFGGVIITDWYEDPKTPGERFKVNALILDRSLRADGVKITIFKQKLEKGTWRDKKVDSSLEKSLEDTILTRARQLKVTQPK
jgi:hypothetical protein